MYTESNNVLIILLGINSLEPLRIIHVNIYIYSHSPHVRTHRLFARNTELWWNNNNINMCI